MKQINVYSQIQLRGVLTVSSITPERSCLEKGGCLCKSTSGLDGGGTDCHAKMSALQRQSGEEVGPPAVPPILHKVLRLSSQPLDSATSALMKPQFSNNFSQLRTGIKMKPTAMRALPNSSRLLKSRVPLILPQSSAVQRTITLRCNLDTLPCVPEAQTPYGGLSE